MVRQLVIVAAAVVAVGCDGSEGSPAPGPTPGPVQITGSERLGWDQPASSAAELATFGYNMHIDGAAVELDGVQCNLLTGGGAYPCDVRLPPLSPGAHTLALSAFVVGSTGLESSQSAPLQVFVVAGASQLTADGRSVFSTVDGTPLGLHLSATGLVEPTDIAVTPNGRVFVAERSGRIVVFEGDPPRPTAALFLPEVHTAGRGGLLALAADPEFRENGLLFAVYTTPAGFEVARFRMVANQLGERLVLVHDVEPSFVAPAASLRFGPDGKMFVAFDDGADSYRAGDPGSFNGKVLRLNPDGTTPADQAGGSPVYAMNVNTPRGIDWNSPADTMWILERDPDGVDRVQAIAEETTSGRRGTATVRYSLPAGTGAGDLAVYRHDLFPGFRDNLLVAGIEKQAMLRMTVDASDPTRVVSTEWLLQDAVGPIRALTVGVDGTIYLCTTDSLLTVRP
jgi:glucose/arabinose dehydrogenase